MLDPLPYTCDAQTCASRARGRVKKMRIPPLLIDGDSLQTAVFAGVRLCLNGFRYPFFLSLSQNGYRLRKFSVPADSDPRFTGNLQVSL
jgi:hypothetical protein